MNFDINLGNTCNFRCKYCFESIDKFRTGKMLKPVANKAIAFIDKILENYPHDNHTIYFWGGEPFLHVNRMEQFLEHYKNVPNVQFLVFTNGYFLNHYVDFITKWKDKLTLQISYDFEPCNSNNRLRIDGKAVSQKVLDNIFMVDKLGLKYFVKSTMFLNDLEDHLYDVYMDFVDFRSKINNKDITLSITPDTRAWEHWILDYSKIEHQCKKLLKYFLENKIETTYMSWFDAFKNVKALCNSIKTGCMIDMDGKVYPCHGCSFMDESYKKNYAYLDLMDSTPDKAFGIFNNFTQSFDISEPKQCLDCNVSICFKCSAHNSIGGDKTLDSWNVPNEDYVCKMYMVISKYVYAYQKIKSNNFRIK